MFPSHWIECTAGLLPSLNILLSASASPNIRKAASRLTTASVLSCRQAERGFRKMFLEHFHGCSYSGLS